MAAIVCLKSSFLTLANIVDFERTIRFLYKEHNTLSAKFTENQRSYEFAKYLRNKFVGHILPELIEKAVEWKPELRCLANQMDNPQTMIWVNIFVLETVINTYVGEDGKHKVFESETDLIYPPDWNRFVDYLEKSIRSAIHFLDDLCAILSPTIDAPPKDLNFEPFIHAGKNNFSFLKKYI